MAKESIGESVTRPAIAERLQLGRKITVVKNHELLEGYILTVSPVGYIVKLDTPHPLNGHDLVRIPWTNKTIKYKGDI